MFSTAAITRRKPSASRRSRYTFPKNSNCRGNFSTIRRDCEHICRSRFFKFIFNCHMNCRICQSAEVSLSVVTREMMFGLRDEFTYFECAVCGCVQIQDIPADLGRYYPQNYYSFQESGRVE